MASDMRDIDIQLTAFLHEDATGSLLKAYPNRAPDPYLIDYLVAAITEIITVTKRQEGIYDPPGPLELCSPLLFPYYNTSTNETIPNPNFPACQPCSFLSDNVNGTCKVLEPKTYSWPFYISLQGMVK